MLQNEECGDVSRDEKSSVSPRFVAYNDPNIPPKDPVRYRAPKAFPRLLACKHNMKASRLNGCT